jgi:hypothetical protein
VTEEDCVVADKPRSCCGCPEVLARRALEQDRCWYEIDRPRELDDDCYPKSACDVLCGACEPVAGVLCVDNRCQVVACEDGEQCAL